MIPPSTEHRPCRAELAVFLAVAAITYLSIARVLDSVNPWSRMAPIFAVVERGVLNIDPVVEAGRTIDWSRRDGHYYSNKAPGPMFLAVPIYWAQHLVQEALGVPNDAPAARNVAQYVANLVSSVAPTLLALHLMWRLLVERLGAGPEAAFVLTGTWAFGSLALPYTVVFMGHQTGAAFITIAVALILLEQGRAGGIRPRVFSVAGAAAGMAAASDWFSTPLAGVWTAFVAWRFPRGLLPWLAGAAVPAAAGMAYNAACFGSPLTTGFDPDLLNPIFVSVARLEPPSLSRLVELTVNPWRGLFYATPVFLMIFPGVERISAEARRHPEIVVAAAGVIVDLLLLAAFPAAYGGACIGPRYFTAALPLCILLMVPAARMMPRLLLVLGIASAVMMLAATLTEPLPHESIKDPFRETIFPTLASAESLSMRNVFTEFLGFGRLAAFGAYLGLWGGAGLWIHLRLRGRTSPPAGSS